MVNRAVPSIPSQSRGMLSILEREKTQQEKQPGPGSYDGKKQAFINSKGTVWAKDKVRRFVKVEKGAIGPGQYSVEAVHEE
jgi:hypothetical protein